MLINIYNNLKKDYKYNIILIKSGTFYLSFNNDAFVLHNIFKYQLNKINSNFKVGFPLSSIDKVKNKLSELNVNYLIYDDKRVLNNGFDNNNYNKYMANKNYSILFDRIDNITNILKNNIDNDEIEKIIYSMENLLCEIN